MEIQLYIIEFPHSIATNFITLLFSYLLRLKKINPRMAQSIKMGITTPITVPVTFDKSLLLFSATAVEFDNLPVETYNACMQGAQN